MKPGKKQSDTEPHEDLRDFPEEDIWSADSCFYMAEEDRLYEAWKDAVGLNWRLTDD